MGSVITFGEFECVSTKAESEPVDYHALLDAIVITSWAMFTVGF